MLMPSKIQFLPVSLDQDRTTQNPDPPMKFLRRLLLALLFIYLLPALSSAGWWYVKDRPGSWREADWSSAKILPSPTGDKAAAIYVFSATTGGMKGAIAS